MAIFENINQQLREFIINEARSCSMDFGCITPEYVYGMWGGQVSLETIEEAFRVYGSRFLDEPSGRAERMVND